MKQEEKELLLKDLCARLPYKVVVTDGVEDFLLTSPFLYSYIEMDCKPYLRPMSSMTEEEFKEYYSMLEDVDKSNRLNQELVTKIVDWLDKKMFDHRNLVPKGLALEAPEGMYKFI